jgi:hypothetical protein
MSIFKSALFGPRPEIAAKPINPANNNNNYNGNNNNNGNNGNNNNGNNNNNNNGNNNNNNGNGNNNNGNNNNPRKIETGSPAQDPGVASIIQVFETLNQRPTFGTLEACFSLKVLYLGM